MIPSWLVLGIQNNYDTKWNETQQRLEAKYFLKENSED